MSAVVDRDPGLVDEVRPDVATLGRDLRERAIDVDLGERVGGAQQIVGADRDPFD